jgi:hypothetical protein
MNWYYLEVMGREKVRQVEREAERSRQIRESASLPQERVPEPHRHPTSHREVSRQPA